VHAQDKRLFPLEKFETVLTRLRERTDLFAVQCHYEDGEGRK
jgi:hypothetical protein